MYEKSQKQLKSGKQLEKNLDVRLLHVCVRIRQNAN